MHGGSSAPLCGISVGENVMAARRLYLAIAVFLFLVLFVTVFVPYIFSYINYLSGYKTFEKGSSILYKGYLDFYFTLDDSSGRIIKEIVNSDLQYSLLLKNTGSGVQALIKIYNESSGNEIFNANKTLSYDSDLVQFFLPRNSSTKLYRGLFSLNICNVPGKMLVGSSLLMPSVLGVPRLYMGMLYIDKALVVIESPSFWPQSWKESCKMPNLLWTGTFLEYVKLKKGYMLSAYTAYYGTDISGNPAHSRDINEAYRRYGSPLLDILVETFNISFLKSILDISKNNTIHIRIVRETAKIVDTNTYPIDQQWGKAIIGAYMTLTPFSQLLTVLIIIFIVYYYKKR